MSPYTLRFLERSIRNLIKNSTDYEFVLEYPLDEEETISISENGCKGISLRGVIWKELGKEAYLEWDKYYSEKAKTVNDLHLAVLMFETLLKYGYKYVKEAEEKYKNKKPAAKLNNKRTTCEKISSNSPNLRIKKKKTPTSPRKVLLDGIIDF